MTKLKFLYLAVLLPTLALAQDSLTIRDAMREASEHHPQVQAATARAKAARAQSRQAIGYRLPSVDVSESFIRTTNPAESFAFQMNQERFSMTEFGNPANDPNNPDPLNTYMTRAEATLPIFTGGMLHGRTLQARRMARAAGLEEDHTRESVAMDAATAWLNLSKAREYQSLMTKSLATAETHMQRARDYFDQGMLAPSDILRAEVFVAEIKEYKTRADEQAQLAQAALNFQRGRSQDEEVVLSELVFEEPMSIEKVEAQSAALENRPDLQAAHEKLNAGKAEVTVARSSFLPQIGIVGRYDWYDDELLGDNGKSWAIMGQAKINLFHGGADVHAVQKASLEARAGEQDVHRFEEGVKLQVRQAVSDMESAKLRHEAANAALASGQENLRVVEARYAQGVAQMTDLLDAQTALRELEVRELTARYDRMLAGYRIKFVTGQSLLN
ncbi:MAG: TolC family protein [Calditrichaeota bacterium]|nr:TolC family protein [Calditrichota bacterium]MCB9367662.1 TolC family protein [Calditrichota bacterium]